MGHSTSSGRGAGGASQSPQETRTETQAREHREAVENELQSKWFTQTSPNHFELRVQGAGVVKVAMTRNNGPAATITTRPEGGKATTETINVRDRDDAMTAARTRLTNAYRNQGQFQRDRERQERAIRANNRILGRNMSDEEVSRRATRGAEANAANRRRRGR